MLPSSRLLLPILLVSSVLALCLAPSARADTVSTFDVSGSLVQGGTFSGTLTIDVTSGTVTGLDITFPGLSAFNTLGYSEKIGPEAASPWFVIGVNDPNPFCLVCWYTWLEFTTMPTPGSLVGFTGGTIIDGSVAYVPTEDGLYRIAAGSITPAPTATPEPSSMLLLAGGLTGLLGLRRKIVR
jgi:hypothetical protein